MHLHILGICGTLMGSIALLAAEMGFRVTGTDENVYPPMSSLLENAGIKLYSPYSSHCIPKDADLILVGNAGLPRGNPAIEAVLRGKIPWTSGPAWLAQYLLPNAWVLAVAGTHGKTTTSAMIAWILEAAGLAPGFLIGGVPINFGISSRLAGSSKTGRPGFFVIEADEYDTSYFDHRSKFLHYQPDTLVINNLEFDHADIFGSLADIQAQFHLLLRSVPDSGLVIYPGSDANIQQVIDQGCWTPCARIGGHEASAQLLRPDASQLEILLEGKPAGTINWHLTGLHNACNALAAVLAARHAGVPPAIACEALSNFAGVKRRLEVIHDSQGVVIYDDFAHHPTAIKTTLDGLRHKVGQARIIAVIEPASHTMKSGIHQATLLDSTAAADKVYWFDPGNLNWDLGSLAQGKTEVESNLDNLLDKLVADLVSSTHLVTMSNGAFGGLHQKLLSRLML